MISSHDEDRMRQITEAKKPDEPPMPERLGERDFPRKWSLNPTEAQKRLWAEQREQRLKDAYDRLRLKNFRTGCGRRLDPWTTTIDSFEIYEGEEGAWQKIVLDQVRDYIVELPRHRRQGDGVFLIGAPGTGKDHLAVAIAREYILRLGCTARRFFCPELKSTLRDTYKNSGPTEGGILRPTLTPDCVILSDPVSIGSRLSDSQQELLLKIVDKRYMMKKPTIITANFQDEAEAKEKLGAQVVSRLSHGSLRLFCNWEDYREREKRRK